MQQVDAFDIQHLLYLCGNWGQVRNAIFIYVIMSFISYTEGSQ